MTDCVIKINVIVSPPNVYCSITVSVYLCTNNVKYIDLL